MISPQYLARCELLKERYSIPKAWHDLGFEGNANSSCRCPWREDKKPSFSVFDDGRKFKDFASDEHGDVITFVMLALKTSFREAIQWIESRLGEARRNPIDQVTFPLPKKTGNKKQSRCLKLPPLDLGTKRELEQLSQIRGISRYALSIALKIGTLRFGKVCGQRCWILLDDGRKIAEARRLDGLPFEPIGSLPSRKAHTLSGSLKSWPLGLSLDEGKADPKATIILVEGGPDYLAAFHVLVRLKQTGFQPVAILGKANRICSEALEMMAGRRVRIFPHCDPNGGGMEAAGAWFRALSKVGCQIDGFDFGGLARRDGKAVTDLNDLLWADISDSETLNHLLP